jgi:hypothetical protein
MQCVHDVRQPRRCRRETLSRRREDRQLRHRGYGRDARPLQEALGRRTRRAERRDRGRTELEHPLQRGKDRDTASRHRQLRQPQRRTVRLGCGSASRTGRLGNIGLRRRRRPRHLELFEERRAGVELHRVDAERREPGRRGGESRQPAVPGRPRRQRVQRSRPRPPRRTRPRSTTPTGRGSRWCATTSSPATPMRSRTARRPSRSPSTKPNRFVARRPGPVPRRAGPGSQETAP